MTLEKIEDKEEKSKDMPKKSMIQIVDKLPVQEVRTIEKDGVTISFMTVEEYLTNMANQQEEE